MSDDKATIPDELRIAASWEHSQLGTLCEKAADEIDRQAAQIAMLREALDDLNSISPDDGHGHIQMVRKEADRALAATQADVEAWQAAQATPPAVEPVAYGFPNTAITGTQKWMMLREEIPADDQYKGALWIPLYTTPQPPAEPAESPAHYQERCRLQAEINLLEEKIDSVRQYFTVKCDQLTAQRDRTIQIMTGIHALLYPPRVTDAKGVTWEFKTPDDVHKHLQWLSDRIRTLPDEIAAITSPPADPTPRTSNKCDINQPNDK